jgi:predicted CXXCH cytochrome family protein
MQLRSRLVLTFSAALLCAAQEERGPAILRPSHESVLKPGPISVVARVVKPARLTLDGKLVAANSPADNVLTAVVELSAGPHEFALESGGGTTKVSVVAAIASGPAGWGVFKVHPPSAQCSSCHVAKEGVWSLKGLAAAENCTACHNAKKFPEKHTHEVKVLEQCQMCHDPHGSTMPALLIMDKETSCKQCHG